MSEVRQDVGQMSGEQLGLVNHGRQPTVRRPEIPAIPESLRPPSARVSPQFAQRFFQRPGAGRLQVAMLDLVKSLPGSSRHGVGVVQPKIFAAGERMVTFLKQCLVFLFAHGIHAIAHMLHDMEAIKYHLLLRLRHMRPTGFDVCRPHIQTDRFDLLELLWREGGKVGAQARLSSLFANIFHGRRLQIAHQGHVMMAFRNRFLVNPNLPRRGHALGCPSTQDSALHQVPCLIPTDAQDLRRTLYIGRLQYLNGQQFEHRCKTTAFFRPRQARLPHAMCRTVDPRRLGMQVGQELTAIQMPPCSYGQVVVDRTGLTTIRAGKLHAFGMIYPHINMLLGHIERHPLNRPWLVHAQQMSIQLFAFHRASPWLNLRDSVPLTHRNV